MEFRVPRMFILCITLLVTINLACKTLSPGEESPQAPQPIIETSTEESAEDQTDVEAGVTLEALETEESLINPNASQSGDIYFSETFEAMDNWSLFLLRGSEGGFSNAIFDNRLRTEIAEQDTWVYYLFEGEDFEDIRIDVQVENRASNTNYVGMICRYSEKGWYEANILNTGEYVIFYYAGEAGSGQLLEMHHGGSTLIKTGRKINDYALICQGETLTILINGFEEFSMPLKTGDFPFMQSGKVGLSVSTSYAIPVIVDFLQFVLSVP